MISHGVEISIAGGAADEKDEDTCVGIFIFYFLFLFLFFIFIIMYSLLKYKKPRGVLAMA